MASRRLLAALSLPAIVTLACQRAQPAPAWEVSFEGVGPVKFGVTTVEAAAVLKTAAPEADSISCDYWSPRGLPAGLSLMVEAGKVVRVDVDSAGVSSKEGVQVGASVASATAALGPKASVTPHKYNGDGWRYLTLMSPDSSRAIVVEVDSHSVRTWRAGLWPAAGYVEGCS